MTGTVLPTGASRLFPIIGDPIRFVESPTRLTRTLAERGRNALCVPLQVDAAGLDPVMAALTASRNVDGVLVTMPHKHAAWAHCATGSEAARLLQVVSLMRRNPDGSWHGEMLDGIAFVKAQTDHGATIAGARALLIGAGGAGSAIAIELMGQGVAELVVVDPDAARVRTVCDLVRGRGPGSVRAGGADATGFDLVFNASPLGMADGDPLPLDPGTLASSAFVGDVISGHGTTPFVAAARAAGCRTATGADMVVAVQDLMVDFLLGATQLD